MSQHNNKQIQEIFIISKHHDGFERALTKREFLTTNMEHACHYGTYEQAVVRIIHEVKKDTERPGFKPTFYEIKKMYAHPTHVKLEK